jgi:hypothetical protein
MDRLGRNLDDLRKLVVELTKRGVQVQFLKENLTFTGEATPMANLLPIFVERDLRIEQSVSVMPNQLGLNRLLNSRVGCNVLLHTL